MPGWEASALEKTNDIEKRSEKPARKPGCKGERRAKEARLASEKQKWTSMIVQKIQNFQ